MYEPITPVSLSVNDEYVIGAELRVGDSDLYVSGTDSVTDSDEITWLNSRYPSSGNLGFVLPTEITTSGGRFGPNFKYVPEPAALAFLLLGGVSLLRRRNG
jgi:hypothetical protein